MGIELILAGIVALQVANLVIAMGCLLRRQRPTLHQAAAVVASALSTPLEVPATTFKYIAPATTGVECMTCHRAVARFTLTDAGVVCANCLPLK